LTTSVWPASWKNWACRCRNRRQLAVEQETGAGIRPASVFFWQVHPKNLSSLS
jgi:hypothetical protein